MGRFWILGLTVLKPGFWWVIKFKLTSILAPNFYYDCSIRGGGAFMLLGNVLDTKGEGGERVSLSHGGDFLEIRFLCIIQFKLTSI